MGCNGNKTEACGNNNIMSVYQDPTFLPDDTSTISDYAPLGCWTDDSAQGRALGYPMDDIEGDGMTTELCLQTCKDNGFPFAGTEFGSKCAIYTP